MNLNFAYALVSVLFVGPASGLGQLGGDPPPSYGTYGSACGAATILEMGGGAMPGFPSLPLGLGDFDGEGGFIAAEDAANVGGAQSCICFDLYWEMQGHEFGYFVTLKNGPTQDCGTPPTTDGSDIECGAGSPPCTTKCVPFPLVDTDGDGQGWPGDPDEEYPFTSPPLAEDFPLLDSDNDGIPAVYDITPNGDEPTWDPGLNDGQGGYVPALVKNGVLPAGTTARQVMSIFEYTGNTPPMDLGGLSELDAPLWPDAEGNLSLYGALNQTVALLPAIANRLTAEFAASPDTPGAKKSHLEQLGKLSSLKNGLVNAFHAAAPDLFSDVLSHLKAFGEDVERIEQRVDTYGVTYSIGEGASSLTFGFLDNPDGSGGKTIVFLDENNVVIDLDDMPEGSAKEAASWLKSATGDPVNTGNGEFYFSAVDYLAQRRGLSLEVSRSYGSRSVHKGILGHGWTMPFAETRLIVWPGADVMLLSWGDGGSDVYVYNSTEGLWLGATGNFGKITMRADVADPDYAGAPTIVARTTDGTEYHFCDLGWYDGLENSSVSFLRKVTDPYGNALVLERNDVGLLVDLTDTLGHKLHFDYVNGLLNTITDENLQVITYVYNDRDELERVDRPSTVYTDTAGQTVTSTPGEAYTYAEHPGGYELNASDARLNHNLESITTIGDSSPRFVIGYYTDSGYSYDKVAWHDLGGDVTEYFYEERGAGTSAGLDALQPTLVDHCTEVLCPDGQRQNFFHGEGLLLRHETLNGLFDGAVQSIGGVYSNPDEGVTHGVWMQVLEYDHDYRLLSVLDTTDLLYPLGHKTAYEYDVGNADRFQQKNVLKITRHPFTTDPNDPILETVFVYDPVTGYPVETTDSLGRTWTRRYAHHELDYGAARDLGGLIGWGILPDVEPAHLAGMFGLGDLNGNGLHPGRFGAIQFLSPDCKVADSAGPGVAGSVERFEQLIQWNDHGQPLASRDENGTWEQFIYVDGMLARRVEDSTGLRRETEYVYDAMGRVKRIKHKNGVDMVHGMDARGNLLKLKRVSNAGQVPIGGEFSQTPITSASRSYSYDLQGRLRSVSPKYSGEAAPDPIESLSYDTQGRVLFRVKSVTTEGIAGAVAGLWAYEYGGLGDVEAETEPNGLRTTYSYDSRGNMVSSGRTGPGGEDLGTRYMHYDAFGNQTLLVDEEGREHRTYFDGFNRAFRSVDSAGVETVLTLDAGGRATLSEGRNTLNDLIEREVYEWDSLDRLRARKLTNLVSLPDGTYTPGAPAMIVTEFGYGRKANELLWTAVDPAGEARLRRHQYDSLGRLFATYYGADNSLGESYGVGLWGNIRSSTLIFDSRGAVGSVSPSESTWQFSYDGFGWLSKVSTPAGSEHHYLNGPGGAPVFYKDPLGRITELPRDSAGHVTSRRQLGQSPELPIAEDYKYDVLGRVIEVKDGRGNPTTFDYDVLGRLKARNFFDGTSEVVERHKTGLVRKVSKPGGLVWDYSYQPDGQLSGISAAGGGAGVTLTYTYDDRGNWLTATDQVVGRPGVTVARSVDSRGLAMGETVTLGAEAPRTVAVTRSATGSVTQFVFPSGHAVDRAQDGLGRLLKVTSSVVGIIATNDAPYGFSHSRRLSIAGGGAVLSDFDPDGRITSWSTLRSGGTELFGESLSYDLAGNLNERVRGVDLRRETFGYDSFDRISSWNFDVSGAGVATRTKGWTWDDSSNPTLISDSDSPQPLVGSSNALNQIGYLTPEVSGMTYTPDGGELLATGSTGSRAWTYDSFGRPLELTDSTQGQPVTMRYTHDAFDRMVREEQVSGSVASHGYFEGLLFETQDSTTGLFEYIAGVDPALPIYRVEQSLIGSYLAVDPSGNVRGLHNGTQALEAYDYDPFGVVRDASTGIELGASLYGNELFFLSAPTNLSLGLTRLGARFYDPNMGRLVARDPLGENGGLNLYGYANANPLRWSDPSGLSAEAITDGPQVTSEAASSFFGGEVTITASTPVAIMDYLIAQGSDELHENINFDGFPASLADDPDSAVHTLEFFIDTSSGESEAEQATIEWAEAGVQHLKEVAFRDNLEYALDLPENLLADGMEAAGMDPATAAWASMGVIALASGGGILIKKGATKGFNYAAKKKAKSALVGGCFVAGTGVLLGGATVAVPIEDVKLGSLVASEESAHYRLVGDDAQIAAFGFGDLDRLPESCRWTRLDLVLNDRGGEEARISLLRPDWWLQEQASFGTGTFELDLPEQGLVGTALVANQEPHVGPFSLGKPGARPVTGLFTRTAHELISLDLAGTDEDLQVTWFHPLFSADRCAWIPAKEIRPGERLSGIDGAVLVEGLRVLQGTWDVHNVEVLVGATYRAGEQAVLVHNGSGKAAKGGAIPILGKARVGNALKGDVHHAFPDLVDNFAGSAQGFKIPTKGPGGQVLRNSDLYQVEGSLNGKNGIFEWIVDQGQVTHRRFIGGGGITGTPNQIPR